MVFSGESGILYNIFLGKRGCTTQNLHRVFGGREVRGSEKSGWPGNSRLETEWFSEEWSGDREMEHEARHKERGAHSAQTQSQHFPREILRIRNLIEHFHWKTKRKTQYTHTFSSIRTHFSSLYVCVFKQRVSGNFFVMIYIRPLAHLAHFFICNQLRMNTTLDKENGQWCDNNMIETYFRVTEGRNSGSS